MATRDLFATEDLSGSYLALPAITGASVVAPRKLVGYLQGEQTLVRSSNPEGYLIPDIDSSFNGIGWRDGTASPEVTTVEMGQAGIIVHLLSSKDVVAPIVRQVQAFGGNIVMFVGSRSSSGKSWGPYSEALPEFESLVMGLTGSMAKPMSVLEQSYESPALRRERESSPPDLAIELRADASVAEIATRIAALSTLTDQELARLFRVARETYLRWRAGELANPTQANRRRLGLLLRLLQDLYAREIQVGQWLQNISEIDGLTPYQLLERGRLDEVEWLAAQLPGHAAPKTETESDGTPRTRVFGLPAFGRQVDEPLEDLVIDDDEGWVEIEAEAVEDDE